jgi:hypothetical protein
MMKDRKGQQKYQNLTSTGAQDKENKNQKQRLFFKTLARKNSNQNAMCDVLIRDMEDSSLTMREHGQTQPVHRCGVCGGLGHHRNSQKCPKVGHKGSYINIDDTDPKYLSSESDTDASIDSNKLDVSSVENSEDDIEVPIDESIDDMELEEALSASPSIAAVEEESHRDCERNVRRKLSIDLSD